MGLTNKSTGIKTLENSLVIKKRKDTDRVIALAGNPNVGKSTIFNNLTGLNQHTGNWPGKTVTNAQGYCSFNNQGYVFVDIPGTYSLMAHSAEEEVGRNYICFGEPDAVIVVCDATCLERNLNLVLQTMEITKKVLVCINLMDEAKKKNITIDIDEISKELGVPVVGISARKKKDMDRLMNTLETLFAEENKSETLTIKYISQIETAINKVKPAIENYVTDKINSRWLSLKLLDYDQTLINEVNTYLGSDILSDNTVSNAVDSAIDYLNRNKIGSEELKSKIVSCLVLTAEGICNDTVKFNKDTYNSRDRKIDKLLASRIIGYPIMILALLVIFWITITGANYPSQLLSDGLFWIEDKLVDFAKYIHVPKFIYEMLIFGVYRVLAWVVSVMLPPMAIFFPLFTLLEDSGFLPRIAFNLDKQFKKCNACGKQALTMWMVDRWIFLYHHTKNLHRRLSGGGFVIFLSI